MGLERELRSLAEESAWGGPVISAYVDARWRDEAQRQRLRVFWDEARAHARRDSMPERALIPIDRRIDGLLHNGPGARIQALFASPSKFRSVALPSGPGLSAAWGDRPVLLPLARVATQSERALAAVAGSRNARLYELIGPTIESRIEMVSADFEGRRIREDLPRELEAVTKALVEAFDREPCRVFICGTPQVDSALRALLPVRVTERATPLEYLGGDPGREPQEVVERVGNVLDRERVEAALDVERRAYQSAMSSNGGGVLGTQQVMLALQEGRVHELVMKEGFAAFGSECLRCGALDIKHATGCNYCGGPVRIGNLAEALLGRAIRDGAHVRMVPEAPRHPLVGGIAALLRPGHANEWPGFESENRAEAISVGKGG